MFSQLHGMSPGLGKIAAHGVVGGIMSEMQGGSFKSGFLAAGFTQGASQLGLFNNLGDPSTWDGRAANAIGAAIVGGTASVIGGGKFANGAVTGAFSRLFNDLNTEKSCFGKCTRVYDPKAKDWMWVPAAVAGQSATAAQLGRNLDDLTTTRNEFAKQLAVAATVTGVGAFGGTIAGAAWSTQLGYVSFGTGAAAVFTNPNPSAYDYFTLGVGARAQVIDAISPGASLVHQGSGLILDGVGWSLPNNSNGKK